jgi:hypothetical protein
MVPGNISNISSPVAARGCFSSIPCAASFVLVLSTSAGAQTITTFDPPNSINTQAMGINRSDEIVGWYEDRTFKTHGFIRKKNGRIITFDPPNSTLTYAYGINDAGEAFGVYGATGSIGFVRASNGIFATFDPSGIGKTVTTGINSAGTVVGYYGDSVSGYESFIRSADGTVSSFLIAGASTSAQGIDSKGIITGQSYVCESSFVRMPNGKFICFNVGGNTATAKAINSKGQVLGESYETYNGQVVSDGFIRAATGAIVTFLANQQGTAAEAINDSGVVVGYTGASSDGFIRAADGTITIFDVPEGTYGTLPYSINDKGAIAGTYRTSDLSYHGFLRKP